MKISSNDLKKIFENSWSIETTSDISNWNQNNKDWFQCLPTSLSIKELLGWEIWAQEIDVKDSNEKIKQAKKINQRSSNTALHYYNKIWEKNVDLTNEQLNRRWNIKQLRNKHIDEIYQEVIIFLNKDIIIKKTILINNLKKT